MANDKITSTDIKLALYNMHLKRNTYFLTECKTCSTYFPNAQGLLIFDALAITKSYTKPLIVGYEIKVSRSDFLNDNKWHLYLQYCNEFYFVVPKGLIDKTELPDGVGLLYYNPETKSIGRPVKKALYRDIEDPVDLYKYIIYSRLDEDRVPFYEERAEYAKDYLEDKAYKLCVGRSLGSKLAKDLEEAYERLSKLKEAEKQIQNWELIEKLLNEYQIYPRWDDDWLETTERLLEGGINPKYLERLTMELQTALKYVEQLKSKSS